MTIDAWLRKTRHRSLLEALSLGGLALVIGIAIFSLTCWVVWLGVQFFLASVLANWALALRFSLILSPLLMALSLVDAARCDRGDLSILPLWAVREFLHCGPWAVRDGFRCLRRAAQLLRLDIDSCAQVLSLLASRRASMSAEALQQLLPGLNWPALKPQLRLVEGVLLLRQDGSHVGLTEPLRFRLRGMKPTHSEEAARLTAETEPVQKLEPESLEPHELLGVSPAASLHEIKAAYRTRIKECHPDHFSGMDESSRELAERWTKLINAAYKTMRDRATTR